MSRNDQLLVKEHRGKFYVFDVMAESWGEWDDKNNRPISKTNHLNVKEAKGVFDTRDEAHEYAHKLDAEDSWFGSEYGVVDEVLYKDGAAVVIEGVEPPAITKLPCVHGRPDWRSCPHCLGLNTHPRGTTEQPRTGPTKAHVAPKENR